MKIRTHKRKMVRIIIIGIIIILAGIFSVFALWQGICVREYSVKTDKLEGSIKILQISDLHNSRYGKNQKNLVKKIDEQAPDIIVLTGDIAVEELSHEPTKELLSAISSRYPCYYVSGNHEFQTESIDKVKEMIRSYGVKILEGEGETITQNSSKLLICGVDDPALFGEHNWKTNEGEYDGWLEQLNTCDKIRTDDVFTILLSHRPETVNAYEKCGFDLILSGHAHGGQIRIPFIMNGLIAPNQGFFPKYAGGEYELSDSTKMIVSRGLCRNFYPRVFNPPELVVIHIN